MAPPPHPPTKKQRSDDNVAVTGESPRSPIVDLWQQRRNQVPPTLRKMIAGGLAGMVTKSLTAPLERVKILLQTQGMLPSRGPPSMGKEGASIPRPKTTNILHVGLRVVREDGVSALWRGNWANLVRVFPAWQWLYATDAIVTSYIKTTARSEVLTRRR